MPPVDVLVMIHGMVPEPEPSSPFEAYTTFWRRLTEHRPELANRITTRIGVQWGHKLPSNPATWRGDALAWGYSERETGASPRSDEKLTDAQRTLNRRVNYEEVQKRPSPNNLLLGPLEDIGWPIIRSKIFVGLREGIILRGFGDVIYYCSPDGERIVRNVVYRQILSQLIAHERASDVRLHVCAHSLGVTLAHDFLFGLFAKGHNPDFFREGADDAADLYKLWRGKADRGEVRLGSFSSSASQLPIFAMRKQEMVNILSRDGHFDPASIGVKSSNQVQWVNFYDVDDMLGFPSRELYAPNHAIREVQVNSGSNPGDAHSRYWETQRVIHETADLIERYTAM